MCQSGSWQETDGTFQLDNLIKSGTSIYKAVASVGKHLAVPRPEGEKALKSKALELGREGRLTGAVA